MAVSFLGKALFIGYVIFKELKLSRRYEDIMFIFLYIVCFFRSMARIPACLCTLAYKKLHSSRPQTYKIIFIYSIEIIAPFLYKCKEQRDNSGKGKKTGTFSHVSTSIKHQ